MSDYTDAQVEAAARALMELHATAHGVPTDVYSDRAVAEFHDQARAALTAATLAETATAEPETDEREALRAACKVSEPGYSEVEGSFTRILHGDEIADRVWAAGFRRSQPEATRTEWGYRNPDGGIREVDEGEAVAREIVTGTPADFPRTLVRREVTEWTEVEE